MFKIRNLILMLGFVIGTCGTYAAQNQNPINQSIPNKPAATMKAEEIIQRISINTADAAALQKIKGFGKKKAEAVVEYRSKNGTFKSVEEVLKIKVRGLNQKWLDKVGRFITI